MRAWARSTPVIVTLGVLLAGCRVWHNEGSPPGSLSRKCSVAVGNPAPEIDAEDVDGQRFKLSDYQGKVVLLDFWGNW